MATRQKQVKRSGEQKWCRLGNMKLLADAQRPLNPAKVARLVAEFDIDHIGIPLVSSRDGSFYIIDGQHRIEALKQWLGEGSDDQQILCHVYYDLTPEEEAEKFLRHNDARAVSSFDKFRVGVTAGRDLEVNVKRVVEAQNLRISKERIPGAIRCVTTLSKVYKNGGELTLARTLRIVRDAFGDAGLDGPVISGIGLLCERYNGQLEEETAIKKLSATHGGVAGLLGQAEVLRRQTGTDKANCVAAAAVDIINSKRGGKKLPSWWKQ